MGNVSGRLLQSLIVVIGRELLRIITREGWAYWRKQQRERKYEADMAAFRAGKGNLRRPVSDDAR